MARPLRWFSRGQLSMLDLFYILSGLLFFALCWAFTALCEKL